MNIKKILCGIAVGLVVLLFIFLSVVTGLSWKYFSAKVSGHPFYTQEEYNKKNDDLVAERNKYEELVTKYLQEKTSYELDLAEANSESVRLKGQIENVEKDKKSLQDRVDVLQQEYDNALSYDKTLFKNITDLNNKIIELNGQSIKLSLEIQNNQNLISSLNYKISQLETTISVYETFIASIIPEEKVIASFSFDNSIINLQVVAKGSKVSIDDPSTDYVTLNYWTVDGVQVDLNDYTLDNNTVFVANVSYSFDVKFVSDSQVVESQIVQFGAFASAPLENPFKAGYDFQGWSLDGVSVVDVTEVPITDHTSFVAIWGRSFKSLQEYSWTEISAISESGFAQDYFHVGDTKIINMSDGFNSAMEIEVAIMGFDHDDLSSQNKKAGITFGSVGLFSLPDIDRNHKYGFPYDTSGGWEKFDARLGLSECVLTYLPDELQNSIKFVDKKSSAGGNSSSIITTSDKLWLFSCVEISGGITTSAGKVVAVEGEGFQYEYWKSVKDGSSDEGRIKNFIRSGNAGTWALRSCTPSTNDVVVVTNKGRLQGDQVTTLGDSLSKNFSEAICFGFCL